MRMNPETVACLAVHDVHDSVAGDRFGRCQIPAKGQVSHESTNCNGYHNPAVISHEQEPALRSVLRRKKYEVPYMIKKL